MQRHSTIVLRYTHEVCTECVLKKTFLFLTLAMESLQQEETKRMFSAQL